MKSASPYVILLLALTTIGGALLAWHQYAELVELRAAALNTSERADLQKRIWDLQKTNRELQDELAALRAARPDGAEDVANVDRPRGGPPDNAQRGRGPGGQLGVMRELMAKPEVQAMMTSSQKALLDYRYAGLFRNLNLPADQLDRLKSLLIDRQNALQDVLLAARDQGIDPRTDRDAFNKLVNDARASANDNIKSLLGDAGYNQLTSYDQTIPQRNLVAVLQQGLSYSEPLTPSQADQLVNILAANAPATDGPRRGMDFGGRFGGGFADGGLPSAGSVVGPNAVLITPQAVDAAQGVLNSTQLAALRQLQQQQQTAMQLDQMRRDALQQANPGATDNGAKTGSGRRRPGGQ